ncbi:MAG: succinate dehydrogenase/fumarate reductase iron-sulfur subunit, partial [Anaerolineales bacterium]
MEVTLKLLRYNPEADEKPHYQTFTLEAEPNHRVLDLLHHVKWHQDGTVTYRSSCEHGICGSDAMRINGVNQLACKALVRDLGQEITVEPLLGLPVIKDMIVRSHQMMGHDSR